MPSAVILTLICILAVYGAVRLWFSFRGAAKEEMANLPVCAHTVIAFRNNEDSAEGILRALVWENLLSGVQSGSEIIAVDMGSSDTTFYILKKLSHEYDSVYAMTFDEYVEFLKGS